MLMEYRVPNGPSPASSSNKVTMPPKFQPTKGGARKRIVRTKTTHHLQDENIEFEGEIQESKEGHDSLANGSSSSGKDFDSNKGTGNEATSSPTKVSEPMRGDVIKGKTLGFRDSLCWQVKGAEKHFQKSLTTIARGHLKRTIAKKVKIINSELLEYPDIEGKYKSYDL
ncbi:hypothetical protein HAX54_000941 [Datura stramonium]|uniref:Uncharacterized protein n=1 Tax=Datura stramonium TaxID=4076 RepID=A0ABS8T2V4_DATST|nr:hypothetical protein [Datura stramonium]